MGFTTITKPFAIRMIEGNGEHDEEALKMTSQALIGPSKIADAPMPVGAPLAAPSPPKFTWAEEAKERLALVPVGFMRDATRQHIENHAHSEGVSHLTLDIAEAGIEKAKGEMEAVLSGAVSIEDIRKRLANMASGSSAKEETLYFCGVCSHIVREVPQNCPVCNGTRARFIAMQKEVNYYICNICHQIAQQTIPDTCSLCGTSGADYQTLVPSEIKWTDHSVTWTDAARQKLSEIPEPFFRDMTGWRIEVSARKKGISIITPAVIEEKYKEWSQVSRSMAQSLVWEADAEERIGKIPSFVRGTVIKEIESYATESGLDRITGSILDQVTQRWAHAILHQGY